MNPIAPARLRLRLASGLAVAVIVLGGASRAEAHGGDETGPSNYRSEITDPGTEGLSWQVLAGVGSIELTNASGAEVVVLGYQGEPYLRFTPDRGVYRNTNSPATYLNEDRYGDSEIPPGASAGAEPQWEQVGTAATFAWHDHRAHWMSRTDPPQVAAARDREHLILTFTIPLVIDDGRTTRALSADGELRWLPGVAWWPPILILAGVFAGIVAAVAVTSRPRQDHWAPLAHAVTGIVFVVVAANIVRTIDDLTTHPSGNERAVIIISSLVAFIAIGALCVRGWRGHPGGFAALAGAAMLIMLLFGSGDSGDLTAPQLVTSLPDWLRRWTIAASYTVVAPTFLAAALAGRWYARTRPITDAVGRPAPTP